MSRRSRKRGMQPRRVVRVPRPGIAEVKYDRRIAAQKRARHPAIRLRRYIAASIHPVNPRTRRVIKATRQTVVQQIGKRPSVQRTRSGPRLVVHPNECTRRRSYKKAMMRKLAAQVIARSGGGGAMRWRRNLNRQKQWERLC